MIPKIRKRNSGAYSVTDKGQELPQIFATAQVAIDYLVNQYPDGVTILMLCGSEEQNAAAEQRFADEN